MKIFSRLTSFLRLEHAVLAVCSCSVWLGACSQTPVMVTLRSLQASGKVSFVCRGDDRAPAGHKLDECPDYEHVTRRLLGLVTQTATDEVAIVDLQAGAVVDVDPSTPGYSFLRVGARPGAIVTTPGGAASFVGVTGLGKNGIVALPTTCLSRPVDGQPARDLTTWAACRLSSPPGDITVLVDPLQPGMLAPRASCSSTEPETKPDLARECPADLTRESGPTGRRKLLVSLPDEHRLVLIDAQRLLDRRPGEVADCELEAAAFPLQAELGSTPPSQVLPRDLIPSSVNPELCPITGYPPPPAALPTPAGMATSGNRVYVADRTLPVVHVIDVSDPCAPDEQLPLLPYSYLTPGRVVTTSRVAVSPLTPRGKQFVYAIDDSDQPTSSVMAFDVQRENRTPVVFDGAPRQPYLPPDRLRFSAPVRDITFVQRDFPVPNASTGVGEFGLLCEPDPNSSSPGTRYQPSLDYTSGARPLNLRGVFGFAMLTNGQVAVIDVEDFDKPCRRPIQTNSSEVEDFRGCRDDDPNAPPFFTLNEQTSGAPTVTNESSCRIVEPHRPRSASLSVSSTNVGLRAPSLRTFPQFSNPDPAAVVTTGQQPRMLAVNFAGPGASSAPAQVNVGTQLYSAPCINGVAGVPCEINAKLLELDPNSTPQNSLTLPLYEPRSYAQDESPSLTFEGRVFPERQSGYLKVDPSAPTGMLRDPDANFCASGVQDSEAISVEGERLAITPENRDAWSRAHADYVQITGDFPVAEDVYWRLGQGQFCRDLLQNGQASTALGGDRDACLGQFGSIDNPALLRESRDLSITSASTDELTVRPRRCTSDADCARQLQQIACCFPAGTAYTVRASSQWLLSAAAGVHDISAAANGRCMHTASCDPRKQYFRSRAFEVCDSNAPYDPTTDTDGPCVFNQPNVGCVAKTRPVQPGDPGSQCIFESLTSRFVVYRGGLPSTRGMTFNWQTSGGFAPLSMSLAAQSSSVNPQSMTYLPEVGYLAVVDGANLGLSLFDLNSLGVVAPSPFF